jgi:hypothetical protein
MSNVNSKGVNEAFEILLEENEATANGVKGGPSR